MKTTNTVDKNCTAQSFEAELCLVTDQVKELAEKL